ncbi:transmembrane protein, putative (macronuclear) [Tetrahymena thermophila SB210]|uniref:Transmembrane protein, putative n=1 Tax=Tetrahymena thermophila (strain SB210) TaxID=312017 RepID=I7LXE4_TETTS|nr:transmembrane protein, putative [Tetrahymena thermophila SB210]EAS04471.3 transmembrane protein, putative [Tetrahymena thermophila SB210]|eukprot:XP_001024716.3 transmembrane protein, putative [Tetrahymena thermophila SB210]
MDYKPMDNSQNSYNYQNNQQNQPNYHYPSEQAINNSSFHNSVPQGEPIQGAYVVNMQQQPYEININQNYNQVPPYMERPFMSNLHVGHMHQNQNIQQNQNLPVAPPPPPQLQNPIQTEYSLSQPFNAEQFEIRTVQEIQECKHQNPQKYLYVSSPKIFFSVIIIAFYIMGIISLIVGLIILIVVAVLALTDGKGNCDCKIGACNNCNCNCGSCECYYLCDCCLRCCEIFTFNRYQSAYYINCGYDHSYYRHKYHRRRNYYDYQSQSPSCCDTLFSCLYDCCCCSCMDSINLGSATDSCMINKVEVYCTACNTKLKEEWTGTKHIVPSLLLGIFGVIILIVSILLLKHYQS